MKRDSVSLLDHFVNFVIDRRKLVLFLYIIAVIFSIFSMGWVEVEEDIIHYLSENSNTRQGLEIMDQELKSPGMADVMISNISYSRVEKIIEEVEKLEGVSTVVFENTEDHYRNSSALFIVQFQEEETEQLTLDAMEGIRKIVEPYDHAISTTVGGNLADELTKDMTVVGILATIVVIVVLIFTSNSYGEIPVLLITFGVAALLNMGTNFLFGKISFVSNSVAVVLQLALAIDYAIILCHRFNEERFVYDPVNAAKEALKKAIVEISSSSLTTIAGLAALSFME
ncbi:MAG TPA: MMPL family transporter, partial [Tissierellaceae bacterium]|nr:MMPL family transporter [Tissierellaceae bacterium]